MDELQIWQAINACTTVEQLKSTIKNCFPAGVILGDKDQVITVIETNKQIDVFALDHRSFCKYYRAMPTGQYSIRQQLLMILEDPKQF